MGVIFSLGAIAYAVGYTVHLFKTRQKGQGVAVSLLCLGTVAMSVLALM